MPLLALSILAAAATVLQAALIPALLPRVLQPDLFLLIGIAAMLYGSKEFGLTVLFVLGVAADLIGAGRLGLTPLCYLFAAGFLSHFWMRELTRGDVAATWLGALAATLLSQLFYVPLAALFTPKFEAMSAVGKSASLLLAACLWGVPVIYLTGRLLFKCRVMSPQVLASWKNDANGRVTG